MQAALTRLTKQSSAEELWQAIVERIEAQQMPAPGKLVEVGKLDGKTISLFRRKTDDQICLYGEMVGMSAPVAFWGRDRDITDSECVGMWKLTSEARRNFDKKLEY